MKQFTQRNLPFPDPRSAKELAQAILDFVLLPARDDTDLKGNPIKERAKTFASVSLDAGAQQVVIFRHTLFSIARGDEHTENKALFKNALSALQELSHAYQNLARQSRQHAQVEFVDTPNGPVGRHNASIAADINNAENYTVIAGKLHADEELLYLVQALANKLEVRLHKSERSR